MASIKKRKDHMAEYNVKYSKIPNDHGDRMRHIVSKNNLGTSKNIDKIRIEESKLREHLDNYSTIKFTLLEVPQTSHRGKARTLKSGNKMMTTIYVPNAKENKNYMSAFAQTALDMTNLICTEMEVKIKFFLPTPSSLPKTQILHCENELIRPIVKPDVDNVSKTYLDMSSGNIFLDDALVTELLIQKRYSIKPRVEISIKYFGKVPNKHIYKSITDSSFFKSNIERFSKPEIVL
ncbi:MAG: RusA family crossover junction endodeoxyribonuclease [Fusobacteriaceae bacterium]